MTSFVPDIDRARMGSPDRVDALVWALTELVVERQPYEGLMRYYEQQIAAAAAG
jgi:phage terminase large subunit-like protein